MGNDKGVAGLRVLAQRAAIITIALSLYVFAGYIFDIPTMRSLLPGLTPMRVNSAFLLLLAGVSAWLLEARRAAGVRIVLGTVIITVAAASLVQDVAGIGVDTRARTSPPTALLFSSLGLSIVISARWLARRRAWRAFAIITAAGAITVLFGYAFRTSRFYTGSGDRVVSLPSAIGLLLAALAVLLAHPNVEVSRWMSTKSSAWPLLRRLLWWSFLTPIGTGIVVRQGVIWGVYGEPFAFALFTATSTLFLVLLAFVTVKPLAAAEDARVAAQRALERNENDLRITLDSIGDAVIATDETNRVARMNPVAELLTGWPREEAKGKQLQEVVCIERTPDAPILIDREGNRREIADSSAPIRDTSGNTRGFVLVFRDVTATRRTEDQLRQAQKMDAIGRLAGGIAHDFNNILSVVLSLSDLLLEDMPPDAPHRAEIADIGDAGRRAATLTRQLLRFSRHELVSPKVVDLNQVVTGVDVLLRRMVRENIAVSMVLGKPLGHVRVDVGSIEQVLLNLVVNARDAMPNGGKVSIETQEVDLDPSYSASHPGTQTGKHVMLAVSDTGIGMDKATQARIFEPFFTTKANGQGTGLGLASVFGVMKQCGGSVYVYSEPDKGATFKLYFPVVDQPLDRITERKEASPLGGSETILLVEDEPQVRAVSLSILRGRGYTVIEARSGEEALAIVSSRTQRIHLLVTDVIMHGMSGFDLAQKVKQAHPETRVLCMSGYTDKGVLEHGLREADAFIQKPITPESLSRKVREVLDA